MKIVNVAQGSLEWFEARAGIITASELDSILTPKFEPRDGKMPKSYVALKVAERWTGVLQSYSSASMEQGSIREEEARPWLALELDKDIETVGFITTDDGKLGCSPDGLFADGTGCEIKCPEAHTHMKYLIAGGVPDEYLTQVHGAMLVTGAKTWTFLSYRHDMPKHVVTVHRNEKMMAIMADAIAKTNEEIEEQYKRLVEQYGPPKRAKKPVIDDISPLTYAQTL